jgi:hypothetical protein
VILDFWNNPEFVRHRRSEMRPSRTIAVVLVVIVVCVLIAMGSWADQANQLEAARHSAASSGHPTAAELQLMEQQNTQKIAHSLFGILLYAQCGLLSFWVLLMCAQGVSGERERKTWDFQRTTRLRPAELLVGKLCGEPVLAYFILLCCFPITAIAGLLGRVPFSSIVAAYLLIISSMLFAGVVGLWLSSLFESRSRGIAFLVSLAFYGIASATSGLKNTSFAGFAGFSPLTGLEPLVENTYRAFPPAIFGTFVPWLAASLLLYSTFGAWFVLMLIQNLKRDPDDLQLLSRWQVVGCAAFLNFLIYAFFNPRIPEDRNPIAFATGMVTVNAFFLFALGLATLTPHSRLKAWWRRWKAGTATLFSEDGLSWPWLLLSASAAYGLLVWGLSAWQHTLGYDPSAFRISLIQMIVVLIFVTRDVLFIQWCTLTRMRGPLLKGILYLVLYYFAIAMVAMVLDVYSSQASATLARLATPVGVFARQDGAYHFGPSVFIGMALQLTVVGALLMLIARRLSRPALAPVAAGD